MGTLTIDNNRHWKTIIITGTPGVGKTTVSKALADRRGALYVSIGDLVEREKLIIGVDEKRRTFIADISTLSQHVSEIIRTAPTDVVVDGHFAQDVVSPTLVSHVFVLRRDPEALIAEFEARGYDKQKMGENLASEILDVCLVGAVEAYGEALVDEIDVTTMSIPDVVEAISKVLDGQRKPKVGVVDWLNQLENDGRLDKILTRLGTG